MRVEEIDVVKRNKTKSVSENDIKDFFNTIESELSNNIGKVVIVSKDDLKDCKSFSMLYNILKPRFRMKRLNENELAIIKLKTDNEVHDDQPIIVEKKEKKR
jgi:hypothetical protein